MAERWGHAVASMAAVTRRTEGRRVAARRATLALSYALLIVSCESPFAPDETAVARLESSPLSLTLTVGETRPVTARALDNAGNPLGSRRLFWSSQNPAVATVSQAGIITGVGNGNTQVAVSAGGKSALIPVTVNPRPISLVRVTPSPLTLLAGASGQLTAQALDAGGSNVTGRPVIWATSSAAIATVTSTGLVTGVAAGTANLTATIDGVVGSSVVNVQPVPVASIILAPSSATVIVGQSLQLTATPRDSVGNALSGRPINWTSSNASIASVSSTGLVTALSRGTSTITASSERASATARLTIALVPVDTITVSPATATLAAGRTLQLTARAVDSAGNLLTGRQVAWGTDQPSIATVSADGVVTGIAAGRATISASIDGKTGTAVVTVTPVPVATLSIAPGSGAITLGQSLQLTATARDADNNVLPGRIITWISGAPSVATVTQGGLVTAVGTGSALIFAAAEGIAASVSITVTSVGVASVRVTPSPASVQQGRTLQLTAEALDASGSVLTGRSVSWNSMTPTVASVSSTGLVTGIAVGTANVTATIDGVVGTASVTVTPTAVATVSIIPGNPTMTVGTNLTLTALLFDASGVPLSPSGRTITWASTDPSIVTITSGGVLTSIAPGQALVTVRVDTANARTVVTVTNIPVANVTLAPSTVGLQLGQTAAITATARDAAGNILTGRPVTWTSSAVTVATVNTSTTGNSNTITAVGAGSATIRATIGGVQGVSTVTVTSVPIATIAVTPNPTTVQEFATAQLTATARDAAGNVLTGRTLVWSSSNNAVASVSQAGLVTANVPGTVTITAASTGQTPTVSGTSSITVSFAPVAAASITPNPLPATVGLGTQASAVLTASGGQTLSATGRTLVWSIATTPAGAATVNSSTGLVTGVAPGSGTLTLSASSPGQTTPVVTSIPVSISNVQAARIAFSTFSGTLHIGSPYARSVTATAFDASNNPLPGRLIAWSTLSPDITISPSNSTNGLATITGTTASSTVGVVALTQGASGLVGDTLFVTTDLVPIGNTSTVALSPTSQADSVIPGATNNRSYLSTPRDSAGNIVSGTALGGRTPAWSLPSGATFASIAPSGATATVTPNAPGTVTVQADWGTAQPTASLRILVPVNNVQLSLAPSDSFFVGGSTTLVATARDAANATIAGRVVNLTSAAPSTAAIGTPSGSGSVSSAVNGVSAPGGRAVVTLTANVPLDGLSNTTTVKVLAPVSAIAVASGGIDSLYINANVQATATLTDASGNVLTGRPVTWSTGNPLIATVAQTGIATGVAAGSTTIVASAEGRTGSKSIKILAPVNSVAITAPDSSIFVGQAVQTTVTLLDATNQPITGRLVTYTTNASAVATVSASGLVTAVGPGTATITATSEGKSASFTLTASLVPVSSVTVALAPPPAMTNIHPTHQFPATVTARDSVGGVLGLTGRVIVWSTSDATIATVAAGTPGNATVTAVKVGSAIISATVDGVAATAPPTVTVKPVPVSTVQVSPSTASVQQGASQQFTATARDSIGGALTGPTFTWSSSNGTRAFVDASTGLATGSMPTSADTGAVNITATATNQGPSGSSPSGVSVLTVTLIPIGNVVVTPSADTLSVGNTKTLTVDVTSGAGTPLGGRACTAASSDTGKLAITSGASATTNSSGKISVNIMGVAVSAGTDPEVTVTCEGKASNVVKVAVQ
jgi:trimeric autotransporter adhesin